MFSPFKLATSCSLVRRTHPPTVEHGPLFYYDFWGKAVSMRDLGVGLPSHHHWAN